MGEIHSRATGSIKGPRLEAHGLTDARGTAMGRVRVLIADDHSVVRQGLRMFLSLDPEIEIVGEAADGEEAIHLARGLHPDVVLMDRVMPGMGGVAATRMIRAEVPDVEVIALTSVLADEAVTGAVPGGGERDPAQEHGAD